MLERILRRIHNRFERERLSGTFEVSGGALPVEEAQAGQYLWIEGSVFNDGLHQYPMDDLTDEEFEGRVVLLAVPGAVIDLADRISDWCDDNSETLSSPYQSESFGGYSYSKASGSSGGGGAALSAWEIQFADELAPWRKMSHSGW